MSSSTRLLSPVELADILQKSRTNNSRLGITGMLLYHDGNIMQLLEGSEAALAALVAKISRDPRHRNLITLLKQPCIERQFAQWSMAFKDIAELSPEDREAFSTFLLQPAAVDGEHFQQSKAYRLLRSFRTNLR